MNAIEILFGYIQDKYPTAKIEITRPLRSGGVWSLDVDLHDRQIAVEWCATAGFGVSNVSDENFGEAPDERFQSLGDVKRRIDELLTSSARTSPPFQVLLSRLRQRRGMTQQELALRLGVQQATVSGIERRSDIQLSTLWRVVEALGGELEIATVFPEGRYRIDVADSGMPATAKDTRVLGGRIERHMVVSHHFVRLQESGSFPGARIAAQAIKERHDIFEYAN